MNSNHITLHNDPKMNQPRMILGFSGWMDGGDVSTGTVGYMINQFDAHRLAEINPNDFYIYNFPGSMETSALFRPYTDIDDGAIIEYEEPVNMFHYDPTSNLILFQGKEPHLKWPEYTEAFFQCVQYFNVQEIYYIGSFSGLVPHTREPRITATVSSEALKTQLMDCNVKFTNYRGPASIITNFSRAAAEKNIPLTSLIAEIPPYVEGRNPRCIEALLKRLAKLLDLTLNLEKLRMIGDNLERKLDQAIKDRQELADHIKTLEENYDREIFDNNMGDLKQLLKDQGIKLD
ncbi:MAG: PAC2 family protein [Phycisphaerae bacterium]|nr:PAC2 family protein [Phycisphaerae bacterium]